MTSKWEPVIRKLTDVSPTTTAWVWPGWIACGKFTLMVGDPGQGKSLVSLDVAARVTCGGQWPDGASGSAPGSVLLLNGEDSVADTVIPRLAALGADLSRVEIIEAVRSGGGEEVSFSLAHHLDQLEWALVSSENPRLIILDPISSFLQGLNSSSHERVRRMLSRLVQLADQWNVAVLAVTHFSKGSLGYTLRGALGSTAFVAAARAVWFATRDPMDNGRQLLLQLKNNLAESVAGLGFRICSSDTAPAPVVQWDVDRVEMSANEAAQLAWMQSRAAARTRKSPREEAAECLRELMADGPRMSNQLLSEAMEQGFAEKTLRRALRDMGAIPHRSERGPYYYTLPGQEVVLPEEPMDAWLELEKRERDRQLLA